MAQFSTMSKLLGENECYALKYPQYFALFFLIFFLFPKQSKLIKTKTGAAAKTDKTNITQLLKHCWLEEKCFCHPAKLS